jgi:prophage antirepressor-like protein
MESIFDTLDKNYIKYGKNKIHVVIDNNDEIWFSAKDTAIALGYKNSKDAIIKHVYIEDTIRLTKLKNISKQDIHINHPMTVFINEAGLYSLVLRSNLKSAKKFKYWVTHDVLPTIRKYGSYKLKQSYEKERIELIDKLNYFMEENKLIKNDLKKNKYPNGAVVYVIDYSTKYESIYRLGRTTDMKKRKKLYDTHMIHKRNVVIMKETKDPIRLETCVRAMLYDHRYKDNKDFFICNLSIIKNAFSNCIKSIKLINNMKGGSKNNNKNNSSNIITEQINLFKKRKYFIDQKLFKLNKKIYG